MIDQPSLQLSGFSAVYANSAISVVNGYYETARYPVTIFGDLELLSGHRAVLREKIIKPHFAPYNSLTAWAKSSKD
jgi:hypothetical protein